MLLAVSLAISLLSVIGWPLSYFWYVTVAYTGTSSTHHVWTGGGQLVWLHQTGAGLPEFFQANSIEIGRLHVDAGRYHDRSYDDIDRWNTFRASLRFGTQSTSIAVNSGKVINRRHTTIPFWPIAWFFAMPPAIAWQRYRLRRRRQRGGLCLGCGYDLRASPGRCPECGAAA